MSNPVELLITETMAERSCDRNAAAQWLAEKQPAVLDAAFKAHADEHQAKLDAIAKGRA